MHSRMWTSGYFFLNRKLWFQTHAISTFVHLHGNIKRNWGEKVLLGLFFSVSSFQLLKVPLSILLVIDFVISYRFPFLIISRVGIIPYFIGKERVLLEILSILLSHLSSTFHHYVARISTQIYWAKLLFKGPGTD